MDWVGVRGPGRAWTRSQCEPPIRAVDTMLPRVQPVALGTDEEESSPLSPSPLSGGLMTEQDTADRVGYVL